MHGHVRRVRGSRTTYTDAAARPSRSSSRPPTWSPSSSTYGSCRVYSPDSPSDGHVPRNVPGAGGDRPGAPARDRVAGGRVSRALCSRRLHPAQGRWGAIGVDSAVPGCQSVTQRAATAATAAALCVDAWVEGRGSTGRACGATSPHLSPPHLHWLRTPPVACPNGSRLARYIRPADRAWSRTDARRAEHRAERTWRAHAVMAIRTQQRPRVAPLDWLSTPVVVRVRGEARASPPPPSAADLAPAARVRSHRHRRRCRRRRLRRRLGHRRPSPRAFLPNFLRHRRTRRPHRTSPLPPPPPSCPPPSLQPPPPAPTRQRRRPRRQRPRRAADSRSSYGGERACHDRRTPASQPRGAAHRCCPRALPPDGGGAPPPLSRQGIARACCSACRWRRPSAAGSTPPPLSHAPPRRPRPRRHLTRTARRVLPRPTDVARCDVVEPMPSSSMSERHTPSRCRQWRRASGRAPCAHLPT